MSRILPIVSAVALICLAAAARADDAVKPVLPLFPPNQDVCYGRTYDTSYFADHANQKVSELYLFRSLTDDPQSEMTQDSKSERAAATVRLEAAGGSAHLDVLVRLRNKPLWYSANVICSSLPDGGFHCGVECDGGNFEVHKKESWLRFVLGERGMLVHTGCAEDAGADAVWIAPGTDDQLFRLDPQPQSECLKRRDAYRPDFAQAAPPLRVRLEADPKTCFSGNTVTGVKGIASASLRTKSYTRETDDWSAAKFDAEFAVREENGKLLSLPFTCHADGFGYDCSSMPNSETSFQLFRSGANGLTIDGGPAKTSTVAKWLGLAGSGAVQLTLAYDGADCKP